MRVRDRLVVALIATFLVVAGMWLLLVAPERKQVSSLTGQIDTQRATLATSEAQAAAARRAVTGYVGHLRQIGEVMRAVPQVIAEAEVVATIDKLTGANVNPDFRELDVGTDASSAVGPIALQLTFTYWTTYTGLQNFLTALDKLTATDGVNVHASGRLFTVTSVSMVPLSTTLAASNVTKATISADVYLQSGATIPAATTPTSPATTPTSPATTTTSPATTPTPTG
jgi:hypothetical protein